jgi:hypothetical protein
MWSRRGKRKRDRREREKERKEEEEEIGRRGERRKKDFSFIGCMSVLSVCFVIHI